MMELVHNPTHAKQVCGSIWNKWIGFLWLLLNPAGLSSWSRNQHRVRALPTAFRSGRKGGHILGAHWDC